jgi:predicted DNA-binding protein (MmcQ/YjbR family)
MNTSWIRRFCLSLPHVTEHVPWGVELVFKIGGKMFATVVLEQSGHSISQCISMKCSPDVFAELVERPGIVPAPYLARANWVALEYVDVMPRAELDTLLRQAYEMALAKLPKKAREELRKPVKKVTKKKSVKRANL